MGGGGGGGEGSLRVAGRGRSAEELDFNSQYSQRGALWSLGVEVQRGGGVAGRRGRANEGGQRICCSRPDFCTFWGGALLASSPVFIILKLYSSFNAIFREIVLPIPTYLAYKPR